MLAAPLERAECGVDDEEADDRENRDQQPHKQHVDSGIHSYGIPQHAYEFPNVASRRQEFRALVTRPARVRMLVWIRVQPRLRNGPFARNRTVDAGARAPSVS